MARVDGSEFHSQGGGDRKWPGATAQPAALSLGAALFSAVAPSCAQGRDVFCFELLSQDLAFEPMSHYFE